MTFLGPLCHNLFFFYLAVFHLSAMIFTGHTNAMHAGSGSDQLVLI